MQGPVLSNARRCNGSLPKITESLFQRSPQVSSDGAHHFLQLGMVLGRKNALDFDVVMGVAVKFYAGKCIVISQRVLYVRKCEDEHGKLLNQIARSASMRKAHIQRARLMRYTGLGLFLRCFRLTSRRIERGSKSKVALVQLRHARQKAIHLKSDAAAWHSWPRPMSTISKAVHSSQSSSANRS